MRNSRAAAFNISAILCVIMFGMFLFSSRWHSLSLSENV